MAEFNLETALEKEELTNDEKSFIRGINSRHSIATEDDFKRIMAEARRECAITVSKQNLLDNDGTLQIDAENVRSAWSVLKDADKGNDEALKTARAAMLDKSEQAMKLAAEHIEKGDLSDSAAMDMQEWLDINNSVNNPQNVARNQKISSALAAQLKEYDEINGMAAVSAQNATRIQEEQNNLFNAKQNFDPFAKNNNGFLENTVFGQVAKFYDNLEIEGVTAEDADSYKQSMISAAKTRTIYELSVNAEYLNASQGIRDKMFLDAMAQNMEIGAATLITAQQTIDAKNKFKDKKYSKKLNKQSADELTAAFNEYIANSSSEKLVVSREAVVGALAAQEKANEDFSKRLTQKTGRFSFINKAREKINKFKQKHSKIAAAMKLLGTVSLTMGVGMVGGAAGLAALGAYRTYKAVRRGVKECGGFKKMLKSPKHMLGVGTAFASTIIAGYGVIELGSAANGMLGNLGVGGTVDALKDMAGSAWSHMTHPIDSMASIGKGVWHGAQWTYNHLTDGHIESTAGKVGNFLSQSWHNLLHPSAAVDAASAAGNETARVLATQRVGRLFVGVGSSLATFSMDITKALKQEGGKAKTKAILKAFGKAIGVGALTVGAYEYGTHHANAMLNDHQTDGQDAQQTNGGKGAHQHDGTHSSETEKVTHRVTRGATTRLSADEEQLRRVKDAVKFKVPGSSNTSADDLEKLNHAKEISEGTVVKEETTPIEQETPKQFKTPDLDKMTEITKELKADYQQTGKMNLNSVLRKAMDSGKLTEEEAMGAGKILSETYDANNNDPDKMFRDIHKGTKQILRENAETTTQAETQDKTVETTTQTETQGKTIEATSQTETQGKTVETTRNSQDFDGGQSSTDAHVIKGGATNTGIKGVVKYSFTENEKDPKIEGAASFPNDLINDCEEKTYVDPKTNEVVCGMTRETTEQLAEITEKLLLNKLAAQHLVYQDMLGREAHGEVLSPQEHQWMEFHKQDLERHNLKIDEEGKVVYDDDKLKEKIGVNDKKSFKAFDKEQRKASFSTERSKARFDWESYLNR